MKKLALRTIQKTGIYRRLDIVVWTDSDSGKDSAPSLVDVEVDLLSHDGLQDLLALRPDQDAATIRDRLDLGHTCFLAKHQGRIVANLWCSPGGSRVHVPYLDCWIQLAEGSYYSDDGFVRPEFRRMRVLNAVIQVRKQMMARAGCLRGVGFAWPHNHEVQSFLVANAEKVGFLRLGHLARIRLGRWTRVRLDTPIPSEERPFELVESPSSSSRPS